MIIVYNLVGICKINKVIIRAKQIQIDFIKFQNNLKKLAKMTHKKETSKFKIRNQLYKTEYYIQNTKTL